MSIDEGLSTFNPSISIAQNTDISYNQSPNKPMMQSIESTQKTEQVHNLYAKLI